jgi:PAS domain-containing protein
MNQSAEEMLGVHAEAAVGQPLAVLLKESSSSKHCDAQYSIGRFELELPGREVGLPRLVTVTISPLDGGGEQGAGKVIILRDVTGDRQIARDPVHRHRSS